MDKKKKVNISIGCGRAPTKGWLNYDNSPSIKLANSPMLYYVAKILGLLNTMNKENITWNKTNKIKFADATRALPFKTSSVDCIYTSHMFEHLSQDGAKKFLKDARRVLKSGGIIRIALPDLKVAVDDYLQSNDADAFMRDIAVQAPPIKSISQKISLFLTGYRHHQWMYDGISLTKLLLEMGFKNVEVCKNGKTNIPDPGALDLYERVEHSVYVEGFN